MKGNVRGHPLHSSALLAPSQAHFPRHGLCLSEGGPVPVSHLPNAPQTWEAPVRHSLCAPSGGRADGWDAHCHCPNVPRTLVLSPQWTLDTAACLSGTRFRKQFSLLVGNVLGRPSLGLDILTLTCAQWPSTQQPSHEGSNLG